MTPIIAKYRLTARDLLAFNLYHYHRNPLMLLLLAALVAPMLWGIYERIPSHRGVGMVLGQMLFSATILGILAWLLLLVVVVLTLLTRLNSNILTDHVLTIAESSVIEETPNCRTETTWVGVQKIRRNGNYLFLYIAAHLAHVIPRRGFEDASSWQAAYDFSVLSKQGTSS